MRSIQYEIIIVNGEGSRVPAGCRRVARFTICRNINGSVVRIGRLVVAGLVTALTGVRRVVVISIVTGCTIRGNISMRSIQHIIVIVNGKSCRIPSRVGGMACGTIRGERQVHVIRVS
jgi:hypothetical protein